MRLDDTQALILAHKAGFTGEALVTMVAIGIAESGLHSDARNYNRDSSGQVTSTDRGIVQINDYYHPEVTTACADSPACAFAAAFRISSNGSTFQAWSTFLAGAHLPFMAEVREALRSMGGRHPHGIRRPGSSHELAPWPYAWNQRGDPAMDGDGGSGPNRLNNCGPESVAETIYHLANIALDADYVWDVMQELRRRHKEPTGPGYTTWTDIQRALTFLAQVETTLRVYDVRQTYGSPGPTQMFRDILTVLGRGHPLIGLFSFSAPNAPDGHFKPITAMSNDQMAVSDVWTGQKVTQSHPDFWAWSKAQVLEVRRRRSIIV